MNTERRRKLILDKLEQEEIVKTQDLMLAFKASESTIRRDLTVLEEAGKIVRIHGGARGVDLYDFSMSVEQKFLAHKEEKNKIGQYAADIVKDGDLIFLDSSTTIGEMIPYLAGKKIKAVTNSPVHAQTCYQYQIPVYMIGGELKQATDAIIGAVANKQISEFFFNRAFLGMNGIHLDFGFSTPDPEEALLKRIILKQAIKSYVLADESKFNRITFAHVAPLDHATIITTNLEAEESRTYHRKATLVVV